MLRPTVYGLVLSTALLAGCIALGRSFGPGFSMTERRDLFAEPPVIEHRGSAYLLTWKQGDYPFYFQPSYEVIDGRLVFALAATSSTGDAAGRAREMPIEGAANLAALQRGGAFWWEPEPGPRGRLVPLRIVEPPQR
jgi:hypothetical protein